MYKLVLFFTVSVFLFMLQAMQFDQHLAVHHLFHVKHALNRSTHAAAQQIDLERLATGSLVIDPLAAQQTAWRYLQHNLMLDQQLLPYEGSFLQEKVEVLVFDVVHATEYPASFVYDDFDYEVTVDAPAIIMIIRVVYPSTFSVLGPITWEIKGVAEVVNMLY